MNNKARNSHSNKNKIPAADMKLKTKNKTEWIELRTVITIKELNNKTIANEYNTRLKNIFEFVNERGIRTHDIWIMIPTF